MIFHIGELSRISGNRVRPEDGSTASAYHSCENAGCDECTGVFGDGSGAPPRCPICGCGILATSMSANGFATRRYRCSVMVSTCRSGPAYSMYSPVYHTANDSDMMAASEKDDII